MVSKKAARYLSSSAMDPNSPLAQDQDYVWRDYSIIKAIEIAEDEMIEKAAKVFSEYCKMNIERIKTLCQKQIKICASSYSESPGYEYLDSIYEDIINSAMPDEIYDEYGKCLEGGKCENCDRVKKFKQKLMEE